MAAPPPPVDGNAAKGAKSTKSTKSTKAAKSTKAVKAANALVEERETAAMECDVRDDVEDATVAAPPPPVDGNAVNSCIKMKLASFCPDAGLRKLLSSAVMDCNVVLAEAYAFANYHVTRVMEAGGAVEDVGAKFYYACLTAVTCSSAKTKPPSRAMAESAKSFAALRPEGVTPIDFSLLGDIKSELCIGMAAMAANHLWLNLQARLNKYLAWKHPDLTKKLRQAVVKCVALEPKVTPSTVPALSLVTEKGSEFHGARGALIRKALDLVAELRSICPLNGTGAACNAYLLLPLYFRIMRDTEAAQESARNGSLSFSQAKRIRSARFSLLPNKGGFTISHVPICTRALVGLLRRLKVNGVPVTALKTNNVSPKDQTTLWRKFFAVNSVETFERYFSNRISTDGVAVTVYMERWQACVLSSQSPEMDVNSIETDRGKKDVIFAGVDPGVTDVVTVAHTRDESITGAKAVPADVSSYSSSRYYEEAKFKASKRATDAWNEETDDSIQRIDHASDRSQVLGMEAHLSTYLAELRGLLKHRAQRGYRNMRFMRYRFKQIAVGAICDLIAPPGSYTVVGYGDWSGLQGSLLKRRFSGPQQDIKRELRGRASVLFRSVWEYRTSVTCHETWRRLTNMRAVSHSYDRTSRAMVERKRGSIHKVLHCKSSKHAPGRDGGGTWNRDVNAARNILMLLMLEVRGAARPAEFMPAESSARRSKKRGDAVLRTVDRDGTLSAGPKKRKYTVASPEG